MHACLHCYHIQGTYDWIIDGQAKREAARAAAQKKRDEKVAKRDLLEAGRNGNTGSLEHSTNGHGLDSAAQSQRDASSPG